MLYMIKVGYYLSLPHSSSFFFFNDTATTEIYTLSLHDALPIADARNHPAWSADGNWIAVVRSEEHTSELQSRRDLVCRLLLEKKKKREWIFVILQTKQENHLNSSHTDQT